MTGKRNFLFRITKGWRGYRYSVRGNALAVYESLIEYNISEYTFKTRDHFTSQVILGNDIYDCQTWGLEPTGI